MNTSRPSFHTLAQNGDHRSTRVVNYTGAAEDVDGLYVKCGFNGWVVVHSFRLQR